MNERAFEASRAFLKKFVAILTASSSQRLGYVMDSDWYGTPELVDDVCAKLDTLTLDRVNAVICKYLDTRKAQFVFVTKDADGLAQAIANDTPLSITYNTGKPAELLTEDADIVRHPLLSTPYRST